MKNKWNIYATKLIEYVLLLGSVLKALFNQVDISLVKLRYGGELSVFI